LKSHNDIRKIIRKIKWPTKTDYLCSQRNVHTQTRPSASLIWPLYVAIRVVMIFCCYSNIQKTFQDVLLMTTTAALYNYLLPVPLPAGYVVAIPLCSAAHPSDNINYSRRSGEHKTHKYYKWMKRRKSCSVRLPKFLSFPHAHAYPQVYYFHVASISLCNYIIIYSRAFWATVTGLVCIYNIMSRTETCK